MHTIIIIGGGPSGLSAALYAARAGLQPIVFAGSPPGGQLMLTSEVENFPGYPSIIGPELVSILRKQAILFGAEVIDDNITSVDFSTKLVVSTSKKSYHAKVIILATGAQAVWLGLESEKRLRGKGVSACATCDGFFFKQKTVAVVGGGDTAMEEAQTLTKFAKKIYIIHRRDSFRASKIMQDRVLNNPKIEVIWDGAVTEVLGEHKVEGVKLDVGRKTPNIRSLKLDGLFIAIGYKPDTAIVKDAVWVDEKGYIITTAQYALLKLQVISEKLKGEKNTFNPVYQTMTSVPGVFAAGDCVDHVYRQAGTAAGMGIAAALDAERWLERRENE